MNTIINEAHIELFPGNDICTGGCEHCEYKNSGKKNNIDLTQEQKEFFLLLQDYISKSKNPISNSVNIAESLQDSKILELPLNENFIINQLFLNLGNELTNELPDIVIKHLSNLLGNYKNNNPQLTLAKHFKGNDLSKTNGDKKNIEETSNIYRLIIEKIITSNSKIEKRNINLTFTSNTIRPNEYDNKNPYNNVYYFQEIVRGLINGKAHSHIDSDTTFNEGAFLTQSGIYYKNEEDKHSRIGISYRGLSVNSSLKEKKDKIIEDDKLHLALYPERVLFGHSTFNVNDEDFWFSYEEIGNILKNSKSIHFFHNEVLKILEGRGVDVTFIKYNFLKTIWNGFLKK